MNTSELWTPYEIERGKPMPSKNHAIVQSNLAGALLAYRSKYTVLSELSLKLPGREATPDICIYAKLPFDLSSDEIKMTEPPLLIVEIVSPSQSDYDTVQRFKDYFKDGVKSCWLVQIAIGIITVYGPDMKPYVFSSGEVKDPALDISVRLDEIF